MRSSDTYLAFGEWEDNCEELTDEEFGQLMRAVFRYWRKGENPAFSDRFMRACWKPIQQAIDRSTEAYEAKCELNRQNGKKGGRPRKEETEKANGYSGFLKKPKKTLPDPDPDPERDRDYMPPKAAATTKSKSKNKFKNFDERQYPDEVYERLEKGDIS